MNGDINIPITRVHATGVDHAILIHCHARIAWTDAPNHQCRILRCVRTTIVER
ncbi:hypothetical protein HRJ45_23715, partial [Vibrio coralliilyticus]|nr:hypothetical protein [Vibrio coralliilyticus]NRF82122.1 hypothetical protein [Vibrio coralliilyticus]